ncbi:sugar ABC transporter substrate-binding protein [Aeromicrobium sp. UC242_57]|uniref:sugar ABC transporter substrate-binding protein n=1 Tax=Aeromicrobium sp. UC242_57 TaxID=3374624 RepID=UPI00378F20F9
MDGSALKGKSIWIVTINNAGTVEQFVDNTKEVASELGATVGFFDSKGSIPNAIKGINQAVAQGADVIVNMALNPALVEKSMVAAQKKGIKVVDVVNSQPETPPVTGTDGRVSWDYIGGGAARTAQAICDKKGELNLAFISADEIPVTALQYEGVQKSMKELCPETCKITKLDVPSAQWATGLAPAVTNLFQRNPDLNYLMPAYGDMITPLASTLKRINPDGKITVGSWDLQPEYVKPLLAGELSSDVGAAFGALAYPMIYQSLRLLNGEDPTALAGSWRMVTTSVGKELGLDPVDSPVEMQRKIFGENVVDGTEYRALWMN